MEGGGMEEGVGLKRERGYGGGGGGYGGCGGCYEKLQRL